MNLAEFEKLKLEQDQATSSERKSSIIDDLDDDLGKSK